MATAKEQWDEALQVKLNAGLSREQAVSQLTAERPDLQEAYVREHNAKHADAKNAR
jgi:hypothetical protein